MYIKNISSLSSTYYNSNIVSPQLLLPQCNISYSNDILYNIKSTCNISPIGINEKNSKITIPYKCILYNNSYYVVLTILHKKNRIQFVIDYNNLYKVANRSWHISSGIYIATNVILDGGKVKEVFLHNMLKINSSLDNSERKYVIHINNNFLDYRLENLRLVDETEYQQLKSKRARTIILPPDCGFLANDIPKYVSLIKANGNHGDRFIIEIQALNISRKLSSSKKLTLKEKLDEAKSILKEIYNNYPELRPSITDEMKESLKKSFNDILELSNKQ